MTVIEKSPARGVGEGDTLVTFSADGTAVYRRHVVEIDSHSNIHGKLILHTSHRPGGRSSGSTVIGPDSFIAVELAPTTWCAPNKYGGRSSDPCNCR